MKVLGLDLGSKTLGVAMSDPYGLIASPIEIFRFKEGDYESAVQYVKEFIATNRIGSVVLGLPKNMNNSIGESGERSLQFEKMLQAEGIDVILWDERLSTQEVTKMMIQADLSRKKRKQHVDKLAASVILQGYLDAHRG